MSELPDERQDPAEQYETGTEVETDDQPEESAEPVEPEAVEVAPSDPAAKTDTVLGKDYEVTPDRGFRRV